MPLLGRLSAHYAVPAASMTTIETLQHHARTRIPASNNVMKALKTVTATSTQSVHDAPVANTRQVALLDAARVQQVLRTKMKIQPHPAPPACQALRLVRRMRDLVCHVKLDSTQAVRQLSAPTAQLGRQTLTLMRPHLV